MAFPRLEPADASPVWQEGDLAVRRAIEAETGARVLVAAPAGEASAAVGYARLAHEYALRHELDAGWAAKPLAFQDERRRPLLVRADPGGAPLERELGAPMPVAAFVPLAHGAAAALRQMHERGLIHRDLKPEHLLVECAQGRVWLTGFGLASGNPRELQGATAGETIAGTFAYMAPEQTGRMNRSVDARSDLYALGVVFYRMLTGALPFEAKDPLEWAYCHIARAPLAPDARVPRLPGVLCALVSKLLAKNAEDRYQTAAGLEADLERCRDALAADGRLEPFALARDDVPTTLLIPEQLHGRERECRALRAAFHRVVREGEARLVMLSGYSGIGKTALVRELMKDAAAERVLFAGGKYDALNRDVPFATLAQAFGALVRQVLREPEPVIARWRAQVAEALGRSGRVLTEVVRELEWLVGPQPPVIALDPTEARNRFQAVFRRFVAACATAEHPLVLFLDDLQWVDPASLALIELLVAEDARHLLLVGAYRDNEVPPTHPLALMLERVRKAGARLDPIVLAPLGPDDVLGLVAAATRSEPARVRPLAELISARTGGNPFFALQLLAALAEERLLRFDHGARAWRWDLARIGGLGYADNVIELMLAKLRRLPRATLDMLEQLACLGTGASRATLSFVSGQDEAAVAQDLDVAVRAGFVAPLDGAYRFAHDRIQEAAYASIPPAARAPRHLAIARTLSSRLAPEALEARLFELADHYNRATPLLHDAGERAQVAALNRRAGAKAKGAAAWAAARGYFAQARALEPEDALASDYARAFALRLDLAECEFLCGGLAQAEPLFADARDAARDELDRARALGLHMRSVRSIGRLSEALALGLRALALLGQGFPEDAEATQAAFVDEQQRLWEAIGERPVASLHDLPVTADPAVVTVMELLADAATCAYNARPQLTPLLYCRGLNLALAHGNSPITCMTYICYGSFSVARGDLRGAFDFAELALRLNERFDDLRLRGTLLYVHGVHVNPWRRPLRESLAILERGFVACQEVGNLMFAAYNVASLVTILIETGEPLEAAREAARRYGAFAREHRVGMMVQWLRVCEQHVANLRGETLAPDRLDSGDFTEEACLAAFRQGQFHTGIGHFQLAKATACLFQGRHRAALEAAEACEAVINAIRSGPLEASHTWVYCLAMAAVHDELEPALRAAQLEAIRPRLERLRFWAANAPENYENRLALLEAELARIEGRELDAMRHYEQAIRSAGASGFVQNEALACERAAAFHRARGLERVADALLADARAGYERWGASALVARIDAERPGLATRTRGAAAAETRVEHLDLLSVVRASQAVSNDIVLESLVRTLLRIALEHAGADRGVLVLPREDAPALVAEAELGANGVEVALGGAAGAAPEAVLGYVARTRERVLIDLAREANPYADDPYFGARRPKSLLCLPLLKQSRLVGLLYLENRLAPGAFRDRTEVLELLATQAAISLENAGLYEELKREQDAIRALNEGLERRVAERTEALSLSEQRAQEASHAKSVFLANMSHELRTPLNAVLGFARLMRRSPALGASDRESLGIIEKSGEHLLSLINQVLSIAKIEAGSMTLEHQPFDLRELLDTVARMFQARTEEAGLAFLVELDPNIPAAVRGDAGKLRQALINLLGNAVKFTPSGSIGLAVRWESPRARFRVSDTGQGIAAEELPNLFQPFVQTASGRGAKEGTGLGLAITRRIVALMGGTITVESEPGVGTRFSFDAVLEPCAPPRREAAAPLVSGLAPGQRVPRIAVVDDAPENRALLVRLLEAVGIEARAAENGEQAIALWRAWRPDLVFMDVRMPVLDGREATRRIRAEERGARTPIVALTASVYGGEEHALLEHGMDEVLFKPYREEAIFELIARRLGVRWTYSTPVAPAAPAPSAPSVSAPPRAARILVTDDDPINRAVARQLLEDAGHEVLEAEGGEEALAALADGTRIDLVLLDVEMPRLGGIETVRRIRADARHRELPVLAMSAHTDAGDAERFRAAGMNDAVPKPLDPAALGERLRHWLGRVS